MEVTRTTPGEQGVALSLLSLSSHPHKIYHVKYITSNQDAQHVSTAFSPEAALCLMLWCNKSYTPSTHGNMPYSLLHVHVHGCEVVT